MLVLGHETFMHDVFQCVRTLLLVYSLSEETPISWSG